MDLTRFSQRLTIIVTMTLGLVAAIVLGKLTANGRVAPILLTGLGAIGVALLLGLKERIWMLLVMAWPMTGQIRALNIPLGVRDIIVLYVVGGYIALVAFKVIKKRNRLSLIDLLMFAVVLMLVIAFIRNPVGVEALGSERVGGRPYFNVMVALLSWWVLSRSDLGSVSPVVLFGLTIFGRCLDGLLSTTLFLVPDLEGVFSEFYSSPLMTLGSTDDSAPSPLAEGTGRLTFLGLLGVPLLGGMFAIARPLAWLNIFRPWKPVLLTIGVMFVMKSGFRSMLAAVMGVAMVSGYLRNGSREVVKMVAIGCGVLLLAVSFQGVLFELPRNIQRTLSFLPGDWDPVSVDEAKASTDWRVFMWKEALLTDRYIENKTLGDGFGMKKSDYAIMAYYMKLGGVDGIRENLMIAGNFHSGPVTCIRYVGYVGLALFAALLIAMARTAWSVCKNLQATRYKYCAYLICLPLIVEPVIFILVFGSFDISFPDAIFNLGYLKLLQTAIQAAPQASPAQISRNSEAPRLEALSA